MKPILISSILLFSFFRASAQETSAPIRYGCYFDFGSNPSLNIGGNVAYSPVKWARLRAEAGVLFHIGNESKLVNAPNADVDFNKPGLHTPHLSLDFTPSIHLGNVFSLDFNMRSLIGQDNNKSRFYFSPGFSLRHGRIEIRTRVSRVELVNIGLLYFPGKKSK